VRGRAGQNRGRRRQAGCGRNNMDAVKRQEQEEQCTVTGTGSDRFVRARKKTACGTRHRTGTG